MDYKANMFVRCSGFLFVRYCCNPDELWDWLGKYVVDDDDGIIAF